MRCSACQHDNPADAPLCGACGIELVRDAGGDWLAPDEPRGERRHLTVMFCDLVESTALSERLDPEDLRRIIGAYQKTCRSVIERFEGRIAQYLGDGLLIYFSYPEAHEDDPERAVRAGLEILEAIREINPRLEREHGEQLAVRIGIHTGQVVVGTMGGPHQTETLALGRTVHVADRVTELAAQGAVVISGDTLRLVQGLFVTRDLGAHALRGIADEVALYQVMQASGVRSRMDVAVAKGLTPLVGREPDLDTIMDRWDRACRGQGQIVVIGGEPGIGKSRLVLALRDRLANERHTWLECRGSAQHGDSALHPVIELLRQFLRVGPADTDDDRIAGLEEALGRAGIPAAEGLPLLAALLSLELPERYAPLDLSPEAQRRRTLLVLRRGLLSLAKLQPVVLVMEDLHWIDPSSLELLGGLLEEAAAAPILVLATHRPVFQPPWPPGSHLRQLIVQPLTRRQTVALVDAILGGRPLPPDVRDAVVERTDGVPLFVEELTKSLVEASADEGDTDRGGSAAPRPLPIPATLQDSLTARLDRLGPAKTVAQLAAVLGRDFAFEQLAAVSGADADDLGRAVAQLETAGFLYRRGEPRDASYTFKHALIQESAYRSLLKETRRAWHERIARVFERRFPALVATQPETIARHCEEGGLLEDAVAYYERAADQATRRFANAEAITHLQRAIRVLRQLPEGPARDERELMLQIALGAPVVAAKGWGSREAEEVYGRARELCERAGETKQLFRATRGLITFHVSRAELVAASELCPRLLQLAEREGDSALLLLAHQQTAIVLYYLGRPAEALHHYELATGLHDPAEHAALVHVFGEDLGVFTRIWMAWTLWLLGHPDRALATSVAAIESAKEAGHPFSLAYALLWTAVLSLLRGERREARELADGALEIAREHDFAFLRSGGWAVGLLALIDPEQTESVIEAAIEEFQAAVIALSKTGTEVTRPMILGALADAYRKVGRSKEAAVMAGAALAVAERTSQAFWNADLIRVRGELLATQDPSAQQEAERLFQDAVEIARKQSARALELRATTSLARLWRDQGRQDDARVLLAPIYASFTEGFETADLREAKALLDQLDPAVTSP